MEICLPHSFSFTGELGHEGRKTQVDVNNITFYEHSETDELKAVWKFVVKMTHGRHLPKLPVDATVGRTLGKLKKDAIDATFDF